MANIKSQIKRNRQNEARRERNKAMRTRLKTEAKKVVAGSGEDSASQLRSTSQLLDKAAAKGILHKRTAARRKSRLARAAGRGS
ncbi:MAG TPA: 30S ribosomal protein S20 [Actinomycetota bacterium]|nr:30S ribosomal protein S20 [Actinomycetota bacterium]